MSLDLQFVYYRNFTFDGQFHVRCIGDDLHKVKSIHYLLERRTVAGLLHLDGATVPSQAHSGDMANLGCPATLSAEVQAGTYEITPLVTLLDSEIMALNLEHDADAVLREGPLVIDVSETELTRRILDSVPLATRQERAVAEPSVIPTLPEGHRYPTLMVLFLEGGHSRFQADLEGQPASPLANVADLQPFLQPEEREDERFAVLANYYWVAQPASLDSDSFAEGIRQLQALDYVEGIAFLPTQLESANLLAAGIAAVVATLITGAVVAAGNDAYDEAQPTPDFEALQRYLNAPGPRDKGLNIRNAWEAGVKGRGARVHFSDSGLYPNHEELRDNNRLKIIPQTVNTDPEHGTASAGVLLAQDNGFGMTGVCHAAELFMYDNRAKDARGYVQNLKQLLANARPGDIVAVNRQTANIDAMGTFLPSLHDKPWWDLTRALTARGVVVLNAACNGTYNGDPNVGTTTNYGVDLTQFRYFKDHGEADAILVGACHSWDGKPHQYSNFNYRYRMLNAWGDSVATLGYGDLQDREGHDRDYTDNYTGTSSATPLVAGSLALIQAYAMEQHHLYLNTDQIHLLVMQSGYADATLPDSDRLPMGARPNVLGALMALDRILQAGRFHLPDDGFCGDACAPEDQTRN